MMRIRDFYPRAPAKGRARDRPRQDREATERKTVKAEEEAAWRNRQ